MKNELIFFAGFLVIIVSAFLLTYPHPSPVGYDTFQVAKAQFRIIGPTGGGGSSGGTQQGCASPKQLTREYNGERLEFFTCCDLGKCREKCEGNACTLECIQGDCQRVWGMEEDWYCDDHPAVLATKVCIKAQTTYKASTTSICPTQRTCGPLCCEQGQTCRNGQCTSQQEMPAQQELPEPPQMEAPYIVTVPFTDYSFPTWILILALIALFALFMILYYRLNERKIPIEPVKAQKRARKRK